METVSPNKAEKGTWVYRTDRNLEGWYYDYDVTVNNETRRTADPYAKGCGVNGQRSMVLDLHIRDFSWDPAGSFAPLTGAASPLFCASASH